jgi:flagellar protein FlaG
MQVDSYSIRTALPSPPSAVPGGKSVAPADSGSSPEVAVAASGHESHQPAVNSSKLEKVIDSIQEAVNNANISLQFSQDEESGSIVITLVDQSSGETVEQIPSKAVLHLAAVLGKLQGQIFDRKA